MKYAYGFNWSLIDVGGPRAKDSRLIFLRYLQTSSCSSSDFSLTPNTQNSRNIKLLSQTHTTVHTRGP